MAKRDKEKTKLIFNFINEQLADDTRQDVMKILKQINENIEEKLLELEIEKNEDEDSFNDLFEED